LCFCLSLPGRFHLTAIEIGVVLAAVLVVLFPVADEIA
jgi:hypothetical protein